MNIETNHQHHKIKEETTQQPSSETEASQTCRVYYKKLLSNQAIVIEGRDGAQFEIDPKEFKKNKDKMVIVDSAIAKIVKTDDRECSKQIRALEDEKGNVLKLTMMHESKRKETTKELNERVVVINKKIERLKRAKIKSHDVALIYELTNVLCDYSECPNCDDDLPCCNSACPYSKTLLSVVERIDEDEDEDEDESEESTEDPDIDEEFYSSEYSSMDEEMEGLSQESDDDDSFDEDF